MNQLSEYLTLRQAAQYLGLAVGTVRMYAWTKVLPSTMIGIQKFVSKTDLDAFKRSRQ
jgi:excisionase family DNA binding protein